MIVQTLADAIQVEQFLQRTGGIANIGAYGDYTRDDIVRMVKDPDIVIVAVAPDGLMFARRYDISLGQFTEAWLVALAATARPLAQSRTTYKQLGKEICNYAVSKGKGGVPIAWSASSVVGQGYATIIGSPAVRQITTTLDGMTGTYFWTTATDALATGNLG